MKRKTAISFLTASLLFLMSLLITTAFADTRYVDATNGNNANSGIAWNQAYKTLAYAIDQAHQTLSITEIRVAKGTYYPEYKAGNGTSDRHKAFTITRAGLIILGGYPEGGDGPRDPDAHPTIMSGNLGASNDNADNAYHVLITVGANIDASMKLDGFTVKDGNANGSTVDFISVNGFDFIGNARCGGWYNAIGSPQLSGMKITNNHSNYIGGGVLNEGGNPVVANTTISENSSNNGGGWYNYPGNPILKNVVIRGNSALTGGGWFNAGGDPVLQNLLITGNTASIQGLALYNLSGNPSLTNSTVAGNIGVKLIYYYSGNISIRNSIIWSSDNNDLTYSSNSSYTNSIVRGSGGSTSWNSSMGTNNGGNLDNDPLFVNPSAGDYRLQPCSPAINVGNTSLITDQSAPDLAGNIRVIGTVDMGAYEYQFVAPPVDGVIYVKAGANGTGKNWECAIGDLQAAINGASSGQQVWVAKGSYQRASSGEYFRMKNNVKIYGGFKGNEISVAQRDLANTADASVLQGNGTHVVYNNGNSIESSALLDGFTITGGSGDFGGGIRNLSASPTIKNCIITNNTVNYHGAGMYNASASPILINCMIRGNRATSLGGGVYNTASNPMYTNCSFSNNTAANGAGIFNTGSSTTTVTNCTIANNTASNGAGGISNNSSTVTLRNSIVYGNSSGINVGDIQYSLVQGMSGTDNHNISGDTDPLFVDAANGNYRLQACSPVINKGNNGYYATGQDPDLSSIITDLDGKTRFYNGAAVDMGAYELEYSTAIIYVKEGGIGPGTSWTCPTGNLQAAINSAQSDNQVWVAGGNYQGSFTMKEGVKIYGGFKGDETSLALRDLRNTANASILTGGIYVIDNYENGLTADAVLDGFTITGGSKSGVRNRLSSPSIINCSIKGNSSGNSGEYGGGFFNDESSPTITNCSITGNRARFGGGGMANVNSSSPILTNCTISGNQAADNSGAIYNESSSSPVIRNSIVYGNTGGIRNYDSSPETYYSLIQGITITNDGNISGDTDPLFADAANGDYRVQACSPVIDRGNNSYFSYGRDRGPDLSHIKTDLNGELRIYNSTVDIGAYEFAGTSTAPALAVNNDAFTGQISGNSLIGVNGSACTVIAFLSPNGSSPVSGEVAAKVWVETTQPGNFLKRHYQITPTTGAETATAKVTLYFTQQEFTDFNFANSTKLPINAADTENYKANLRIEKRSGESDDDTGRPGSYDGTAATINPLDPAVNGSIIWNNWASRWEVSFDVKGFSGFFAKTIDSPLPLNLLSFTATKEEGTNLLTWKTASEKDFSHFEIEYSTNARSFVSVATVEGHQAGVYQFMHRPAPAPTSYYRLRMVDNDGSFAYSRIVSLHGAASEAIAGNLFPNPAHSSNALLDITVAEAASWETGVYSMAGIRLKHATIALRSGANRLTIDIKGLPSGIYLVRLRNTQQEITRKLIVE